MTTFYFDLHVFHSRKEGFSVPIKIRSERQPTDSKVIEFAIANNHIDSDDANHVDYIDEIDAKSYVDMGGDIMLSNDEIADNMLNNIVTYREDIKEIIIGRLMDSSCVRTYCDALLRGAQGYDLVEAKKGIVYKK